MKKNNKKKIYIGSGVFIALVLFFIFFFSYIRVEENYTYVPYVQFIEWMEKDKIINQAEIDLNASTFLFTTDNGDIYETDNPKDRSFKKELLENNVTVYEIQDVYSSISSSVIVMFFNVVIIGVVFYMLNRMIFNKKEVPVATAVSTNVKFENIAGLEESKEEMQVLIDFLKNPDKYHSMNATLPKGVIFFGPPGTGKTLSAKAIATEAGVPFYSVSGSDFVERYVGVGASRVRQLFKKAKETAPCIIFIDEIDAVGAQRQSDGSTAEHSQTVNALLTEMDGFTEKNNVLVIAATNRLDTLDSALIRPGRFDKHIAINLPDFTERESILNSYLKDKPIDESVDIKALAKITVGFSGAALASLVNEATIITCSKNKTTISQQELEDSYMKLVLKSNKKKNQDSINEQSRIIAYHEAGHTICAKLLGGIDIPRVSILSTTSGAGGVTFKIPQKTRLLSKKDLENEIIVYYAGRAAEEIILGKDFITTGASNDIEKATNLIYAYIDSFGMDEEVGHLKLSLIPGASNQLTTQEAISLSKTLYTKTLVLLKEHQDLLHALAANLLEKETLLEPQIDEIINQYI